MRSDFPRTRFSSPPGLRLGWCLLARVLGWGWIDSIPPSSRALALFLFYSTLSLRSRGLQENAVHSSLAGLAQRKPFLTQGAGSGSGAGHVDYAQSQYSSHFSPQPDLARPAVAALGNFIHWRLSWSRSGSGEVRRSNMLGPCVAPRKERVREPCGVAHNTHTMRLILKSMHSHPAHRNCIN